MRLVVLIILKVNVKPSKWERWQRPILWRLICKSRIIASRIIFDEAEIVAVEHVTIVRVDSPCRGDSTCPRSRELRKDD